MAMTAAVELPVRERNVQRPAEARRTVPARRDEPPRRARIVVADTDGPTREICAEILRRDGYGVTTCSGAERALEYSAATKVDVLIVADVDVRPDRLRSLCGDMATDMRPLLIVLAEQPSVGASIAAMRNGAFAYLPKPFAACHLQVLVGRAANALGLADERDSTARPSRIPLGSSPVFRRAVELARKVAITDACVFITGESGSGKEMIAHLIHAESRRSRRAFVPVNCAALPDELLETEMFGHRKGAFTGAVRDKTGLLEEADGGTLFLDELLELPLALQAKLLRVTEDGVIRRVGSETTDAVVDVRLIAATNGDPESALRAKRIRPDLYYRLRVIPIHVPPLRERREDIPLLANHFLARSWSRHRAADGPPPYLSDAAMRVLLAQQWPGNVRELQNLVEHVSVVAKPGDRISACRWRRRSALRCPDPSRPPCPRCCPRPGPMPRGRTPTTRSATGSLSSSSSVTWRPCCAEREAA
jgi:two-component system, NtrC family, response regulator HydG